MTKWFPAVNPFATVLVTARCRNYIDADVGRGVVPVLPSAQSRCTAKRTWTPVLVLARLLLCLYLGERKDPQLTKYGKDQIFTADILGGLFGGPALADSAPLQISSRRTAIGDYVRTSRILLI